MSAFAMALENAVQQIIIALVHSDRETRGHAVLASDAVPAARAWLQQVLTDADKLTAHAALLAGEYRTTFHPPAPTRDREEGESPAPPRPLGFTHCEILADNLVAPLMEWGPNALKPDQLALLLLNPFALYDLAEQIRSSLPEWWIEPLAAAGRDILDRYDLEVAQSRRRRDKKPSREKSRRRALAMRQKAKHPPEAATAGTESLPLGFSAEVPPAEKRRMAEALYGDPERDFTLTLHYLREANASDCTVELEIAPAPVKGNYSLSLNIQGHPRTFLLEVPPSVRLDPEADVPDSVTAQAAEPLPVDVLPLNGEIYPLDAGMLGLRCRRDVVSRRS